MTTHQLYCKFSDRTEYLVDDVAETLVDYWKNHATSKGTYWNGNVRPPTATALHYEKVHLQEPPSDSDWSFVIVPA